MLEQAYEMNPTFAPRAFMLDKDGSEHKAVEAVLLRRALSALQHNVASWKEEATPFSYLNKNQLDRAHERLQQREAREEYLDKIATGATR